MGRWLELEVYMESQADRDRNEKLGINAEVSFVFDRTVLNVDKIVSYGPMVSDDGDESTDLSEIIVDFGYCLVVNTPFEELDRLVRATDRAVSI